MESHNGSSELNRVTIWMRSATATRKRRGVLSAWDDLVLKPCFGILGVMAALSMAACSPSSSTSGATSVEIPGSDHSCEFQPQDGETAPAPTEPNLHTFFFGKSIDMAKLAPLYKASGLETVRYMESQGLEIRGVSRKNPQKCRRYEFLPAALGPQVSLWEALEREINDDRSSVAGVFFPAGDVTERVRFEKPTILVGFDTHRRVLVHEYVHYLYNSEAAKKPGYRRGQEMLSELNSVGNELGYGDYVGNPVTFSYDPLSKGQTLENVARLLSVSEQILTHFALEEVAIEAKFLDDFNDRRYDWVVDHRRSAMAYMEGSLQKADQMQKQVAKFAEVVLQKIEDRVRECTRSSMTCSVQDAVRLKADQIHKDQVTRYSSRLRALLSEAKAVVEKRLPQHNTASPGIGIASGEGVAPGMGIAALAPGDGMGVSGGGLAPVSSDVSGAGERLVPRPCSHPAEREIERYILGR